MESNILTVWLDTDFNYNNQTFFWMESFKHIRDIEWNHLFRSFNDVIKISQNQKYTDQYNQRQHFLIRRRKIIAMFSSISHLQIKRSSWSMLRSFSQIDLNASIAEYLCQDLSPKIHLIFDNKNQDGGTCCIIWWTPSLFDDRITDKLALSLKTCQTVSFYQTCICK